MVEDYDVIARLYRTMLLIRRVEEHICKVYDTDVIKSPVHLSIGQESVAAGICDVMRPDDIISNTYRCHATYIAKGGDLKQMMAELYGKADGCAGGKAGSMHLIDMSHGILGASAVVGTTIPVACGYALAQKMQKTSRVVVCVFGDGATEEGCFYESLNFAALKKLPVLFVCENNRLAIHTPINRRQPLTGQDWNITGRVATYGIPCQYIEDGDVLKIRDAAASAIKNIRNGSGPQFIECETYRWLEHVGTTDDHNEGYRDQEKYAQWKENDQIARLEKRLGNQIPSLKTQVDEELREAIAFAERSLFPADAMLFESVYA